MADETEFDSTYFLMLTKDEMTGASNIDLPEIIKRIKQVAISTNYINQVTLFLLELIKVYDETADDEYYNAALDLCDWLRKNDSNRDNAVHIINKYQPLKRKNILLKKDEVKLRKLISDSNDLSIKTGVYILLGEFEKARDSFAKLDDARKNDFKDYPICRLCKNIIEDMREGTS